MSTFRQVWLLTEDATTQRLEADELELPKVVEMHWIHGLGMNCVASPHGLGQENKGLHFSSEKKSEVVQGCFFLFLLCFPIIFYLDLKQAMNKSCKVAKLDIQFDVVTFFKYKTHWTIAWMAGQNLKWRAKQVSSCSLYTILHQYLKWMTLDVDSIFFDMDGTLVINTHGVIINYLDLPILYWHLSVSRDHGSATEVLSPECRPGPPRQGRPAVARVAGSPSHDPVAVQGNGEDQSSLALVKMQLFSLSCVAIYWPS